jgi:hypothetical protein
MTTDFADNVTTDCADSVTTDFADDTDSDNDRSTRPFGETGRDAVRAALGERSPSVQSV